MENTKYCQSCSIPLTSDEMMGTNADGSKSQDYCNYCYKDGKFTSDMSMEEMIDFCAPYMAENTPGMTKEQAVTAMQGFFPQLKRWAK